jgi:3-oxoacyl-[acyl-carrier protein] reductase
MKRALVTGGSGELGRAIALRLSQSGHHVYVHANTRLARAQESVAAIRDAGGSAEAIAFDVTSATAAEAALMGILTAGPIQILINNAGIHDDAIMPAMRQEQWRNVIDVCLNGFFNVTQPLLLPMIGTRWGRVINISSISALIGTRGQANYAAAKSGLIAAGRSLAKEVASRGITVNSVAPGIIESQMSNAAFDAAAIEKIVPMKRAGQPLEVADLVGFLASEEAAYISGQVISIDGALL